MAGSKTNALKKPKMFKLDFKIKNEKKNPFTSALLQNYNYFFLLLFCMSNFYLSSFYTFLHSKQRAMSSTINSHMNN